MLPYTGIMLASSAAKMAQLEGGGEQMGSIRFEVVDNSVLWNPFSGLNGSDDRLLVVKNIEPFCHSRTIIVGLKERSEGVHGREGRWRGEQVKPGRRFEETHWEDGEEAERKKVSLSLLYIRTGGESGKAWCSYKYHKLIPHQWWLAHLSFPPMMMTQQEQAFLASLQVGTDVGNHKLLENGQVRVWDFVIQPGEDAPIHQHKHSYLFINFGT